MSDEIEIAALLPVRPLVPSGDDPSKNCTVPVGTVLLETVAENVTNCPEIDGFNEDRSVVDVFAFGLGVGVGIEVGSVSTQVSFRKPVLLLPPKIIIRSVPGSYTAPCEFLTGGSAPVGANWVHAGVAPSPFALASTQVSLKVEVSSSPPKMDIRLFAVS